MAPIKMAPAPAESGAKQVNSSKKNSSAQGSNKKGIKGNSLAKSFLKTLKSKLSEKSQNKKTEVETASHKQGKLENILGRKSTPKGLEGVLSRQKELSLVKVNLADSDSNTQSALLQSQEQKDIEKLNGSEGYLTSVIQPLASDKLSEGIEQDPRLRNVISDGDKKITAKKKTKTTIDVVDLRRLKGRSGEIKSRGEGNRADSSTEHSGRPGQSENTAELEIRVSMPQGSDMGSQGSGSRLQAQVEREMGASFREQLEKASNKQIVDQAKMILKEDGKGEIRLILKPEALGNVRIRLSMQENNLVGRIIVDNNTVKQVFEENMQNLLKSFQEAGYGDASVNVEVGGRQHQQKENDRNEETFLARQKALQIDNQVPEVRVQAGQELGLVNVMV